jgi:hypothetical protein
MMMIESAQEFATVPDDSSLAGLRGYWLVENWGSLLAALQRMPGLLQNLARAVEPHSHRQNRIRAAELAAARFLFAAAALVASLLKSRSNPLPHEFALSPAHRTCEAGNCPAAISAAWLLPRSWKPG